MIKIDKPKLDRKTPEENIAVVERWISETTDKLNYILLQLDERCNDGNSINK